MEASLPPLPANYAAAVELIDEAHARDPNIAAGDPAVPYELHYARKMTRWLARRCPDASPLLQIACRAQHFRRWEIPRSSYPMTRAGYLGWRTKQKTQAAAQVSELLRSSSSASPSSNSISIQPPLSDEEIERVAVLMRKAADLATDEEMQVLEDVACLVFLDDQLDDFDGKREGEEEKTVEILRKTWGKMTPEGRALALQIPLSERAKSLVQRALA